MYSLISGLKWSLFVLNIQEIENIFKKLSPRVPTNPFAGKYVLLFYIIYVDSWLGLMGNDIPQPNM